MISVQEAEKHIFSHTPNWRNVKVTLDKSLGKILAEDICAERPQPSFDRVTMDGIAIQYKEGLESFKIEDVAKAGEPQKILLKSSNCLEVMTGSPLPQNADTVIRYEDVDIENGLAKLKADLKIEKGQNIHIKGSDYNEGHVLLKKGDKIKSPHIGILASEGFDQVEVLDLSIAIVSTGDELVPIDETPLPHQIRRSNAHSLQTELNHLGFDNISLFHFDDDATTLYPGLERVLLEHNLIILSGGVSMGKFDLIPSALTDLKVKKVFHKVTQKPGKPLWFGKGENNQLVFGLPGNPVSSLVCLRRFIAPLLRESKEVHVKLSENVNFKKDLTLFKPIKLMTNSNAELMAAPINFNTSGDYYSLCESDGFVELDKDKSQFIAGEVYKAFLWGNKFD